VSGSHTRDPVALHLAVGKPICRSIPCDPNRARQRIGNSLNLPESYTVNVAKGERHIALSGEMREKVTSTPYCCNFSAQVIALPGVGDFCPVGDSLHQSGIVKRSGAPQQHPLSGSGAAGKHDQLVLFDRKVDAACDIKG
jgi:hypothetical protein